MILIAVDSGKSGLRLRIVGADRTVNGRGPGFIYSQDAKFDLSALVSAVSVALDDAGFPAETPVADVSCVGLTGLPGNEDERKAVLQALGGLLGGRVLLTDDGVLAHAGALGAPGTVASIGTGTIITTIDDYGERTTRDAWGPTIGDRGSAYAIGQAGIRAAAAALDDAGPSTRISDHLREVLIDSPVTLNALQRFYRAGDQTRLIAGFAQRVLDEAAAGDALAIAIERSAAAEAAATITAAAIPGTPISWSGQLLRSHPHYLDAVRAACPPQVAEAFIPPVGDSLDGGIRIAVGTGDAGDIYRRSIEGGMETQA